MKFAIEGDHRQFFKKNQTLEIQGLLTENQLKEWNTQIEKSLAERLNTTPYKLSQELPSKIFSSGRDLFRSGDYLKKSILNSQFAEIASDLIEFRPLRFGFDQYYKTAPENLKDKEAFNPYKTLTELPRTLNEITCLQEVLCGLMICLSSEEVESSETDESAETQEIKTSIFSKKAGNAVFFSPEALIDFNDLVSSKKASYLCLVYTHSLCIYFLEENDPQTHAFKHLGYVFGDRLNDKLNPIVYR